MAAENVGVSLLNKYDEEFDQLLSKYNTAHVIQDGSNVNGQNDTRVKEVELITKPIEVQCVNLDIVQFSAKKLVTEMIAALSNSYETTFLSDYLHVLETQSRDVIEHITYRIMMTTEISIRECIYTLKRMDEDQVVLCAFLCAAMLWSSPAVPRARLSLLKLLPLTTEQERIALAEACMRFAPALVLVSLSDMVRTVWHYEGVPMSDLFLRAAMYALQPQRPEWQLGYPSVAEVKAVIVAVKNDPALFAFLGRILAAIPKDLHFEILQLLELVQPTQQPKDVFANGNSSKTYLCKLRILYGENEKVQAATKK